jgi:hypothetical protein
MQSTIVVVAPATSIDLITLDELKRAINISGTTQDAMLSDIITRISADIAALCNNRVFGYESVIETFTEISTNPQRLFLARYPVKPDDIISITSGGQSLTPGSNGLLLDSMWGKLTWQGGTFSDQAIIAYSGGFHLPEEAPPALKQAVVLLGREAYYASIRGDQNVRMIGHKESRIIYFDPNVLARGALSGGGSGGSPATRAATAILTHFTRYEA